MSVSLIKIRKKKSRIVPASQSQLCGPGTNIHSEEKNIEKCFDCLSLVDECKSENNCLLDGIIAEMIAKNETNIDAATEYVRGVVGSLQSELKLEKNKVLLLLEEAEILKDRFDWERNVLKEELKTVRYDMTQYEDYICNEQFYTFKNATWDALKNIGRDELLHRRSKLQKMEYDLNGKYQMLCQKIRLYNNLLSKLNEEEILREQRCQALSLNTVLCDSTSKTLFHHNLIEFVKSEIDKTHITENSVSNKMKQDVVNVKETCSRNVLKAQELGCTFDFVLQHRVNKGGSRADYNAVVGIFEKDVPVFHADAVCEKSMVLMKEAFEKQRARLKREMDIYLWIVSSCGPPGSGPSLLEQCESDSSRQQKPELVEESREKATTDNIQSSVPVENSKRKDVKNKNGNDVKNKNGSDKIEEKRKKTKKQTKKLEEKTEELANSISEMKEVNKAILKALDTLKLEQEENTQNKKCVENGEETKKTIKTCLLENEETRDTSCCFHPPTQMCPANEDPGIEEIQSLALFQVLKKLHSFLKRSEETRHFVDSEELILNLLPEQSLSIHVISLFLKKVVLELRHLEISEMKRMETKDFKLRDVYNVMMYLTNNNVITWDGEDVADSCYDTSCSNSVHESERDKYSY